MERCTRIDASRPALPAACRSPVPADLRHRDRQRSRRRRYRIALVRGGRGDCQRTHRGDRHAGGCGSDATHRIDARGRVVAPGFIDMLGQSELTVLVEPHLPSKIFQGITTEVTGEGGSVAPLNDAIIKADKVDYDHFKLIPDWRTFAEYFARAEKQGIGINMAHFVGATQVRRMVLGDADKQPTPVELDRMRALVR